MEGINLSCSGEIMVVEDFSASLKLMTDILSANGFRVRPADGGELALASASARPPDLILLDIHMPGMDGFEVFRRLRKNAACRDIPVIFVSASSEERQRLEGLELGAADFISKPVHELELLARVRTQLELRRASMSLKAQAENLKQLNKKLESSNSELESFIYSISRHIYEPIRKIEDLTKLLYERCMQKVDPDEKRFFEAVRSNAYKMDRMAAGLLTLSNLCRSDLKLVKVRMSEIVDDVLREAVSAEMHGTLTFSIGNMPDAVCDATMIRHAWMNLFSNAVRSAGSFSLKRIEIGGYRENGEKIFFMKVGNVTSDIEGSLGRSSSSRSDNQSGNFESDLEMSVVNRIAGRHGGRVWIEKCRGGGTELYFSLHCTEDV